MSYRPDFDEIKYSITFKQKDPGISTQVTKFVKYGETPIAPQIYSIPAKNIGQRDSANFSYYLKWDKEISAVNGHETYTTVLDSTWKGFKLKTSFTPEDSPLGKDIEISASEELSPCVTIEKKRLYAHSSEIPRTSSYENYYSYTYSSWYYDYRVEGINSDIFAHANKNPKVDLKPGVNYYLRYSLKIVPYYCPENIFSHIKAHPNDTIPVYLNNDLIRKFTKNYKNATTDSRAQSIKDSTMQEYNFNYDKATVRFLDYNGNELSSSEDKARPFL